MYMNLRDVPEAFRIRYLVSRDNPTPQLNTRVNGETYEQLTRVLAR